ncbi:hypothetical protein [Paludisphaera sp.]|uniref:hypothetical protein n=1 Tax=Paludisphaera sp. TaxID=2017432 RepID=UPI00301C4D03
MASVQDIPNLDDLLESVLDRLPPEAVAAIAAMRPPVAATLADELVRRAHDRARARAHDEPRPLPDEPGFNDETRRILKDLDEGKGVKRYGSAEDFFAAHGF